MPSEESRGRVTQNDVALTTSTKSKAHRLLPAYKIRQVVVDWVGTLYRRGESDEYHLVNEKEDWALSLRFENGEVIVVTQMHIHNDYPALETYREVEPPRDKKHD